MCWAALAENVAQSVGRGTRIVVEGRLDQRSWETPEGDKRSKIEVTADDIGPSLRWATATVTKNERTSTPTHTPAGPAPAQARPDDYPGNEEPF